MKWSPPPLQRRTDWGAGVGLGVVASGVGLGWQVAIRSHSWVVGGCCVGFDVVSLHGFFPDSGLPIPARSEAFSTIHTGMDSDDDGMSPQVRDESHMMMEGPQEEEEQLGPPETELLVPAEVAHVKEPAALVRKPTASGATAPAAASVVAGVLPRPVRAQRHGQAAPGSGAYCPCHYITCSGGVAVSTEASAAAREDQCATNTCVELVRHTTVPGRRKHSKSQWILWCGTSSTSSMDDNATIGCTRS